ncbi:DoxX family protein [Corynebacterium sp. zg-331]|uniref:DoxX family protein n=1 Tax=unclassified Corynebacterium TaxID=2624378 RepID=UPI00128D0674|nr:MULTISPECIES: DoxX family protein [unclassified Corynebacterium]MBC3186530.1 DoxX family protein [Corynebacterium sp. zg-331]MPV53015.1 DoxX family membrane protein [Corynebacterium sp. zg331]
MQNLVDRAAPGAIALSRIAIGLIFFFYGSSRFFDWPVAGEYEAPELFAFPTWWAAAIQIFGGALVVLGLFTRTAAFFSSGSMAVAYFWMHQPDGLTPLNNGGVPSALLCWALFILVFVGPGALSVDALRKKG